MSTSRRSSSLLSASRVRSAASGLVPRSLSVICLYLDLDLDLDLDLCLVEYQQGGSSTVSKV